MQELGLLNILLSGALECCDKAVVHIINTTEYKLRLCLLFIILPKYVATYSKFTHYS